ncbi:hypothetical protein CK498_24525 [Halomonas salipaludis]|uniref:Uncharacterized protein n=1 Tax=Halomonas salipaludis TaxID=2032625 RepID=A0A2A2ENG7_9GAMM|nr:hypothetical protein CK498_24525 [Halomonas salipaludis]
MSERLAERRQQQLAELDDVTRRQLSEHENALQQQLNDARRTTEAAISDETQRLRTMLSEALGQIERQQTRRLSGWETALSDSEARQRQQIEGIEQRLADAANQAERLGRIGGLRSWTRPAAITAAVMLAVGSVTAGGLHLADRLIDSRVEYLITLRQEIRRAENLPRLQEGMEIEVRTIQGENYLVLEGINPGMRVLTIDNGQTPVIPLTRED